MLKFKHNSAAKWMFSIPLMLFSPIFLLSENKTIIIAAMISINAIAVLIFILLTIFPRIYYKFDVEGITCQTFNGKTKYFIPWKNVKRVSYSVFAICFSIPYHEGMNVLCSEQNACTEARDTACIEAKNYLIGISDKQYKQLIAVFAEIFVKFEIECER